MDDIIIGQRKIGYGVEQAIYGDDRGIYATFYQFAMLDEEKSKIEGRPYHKTVDMIKIEFAGDRTKIIDRLVKEEDKIRFSKNWEAYCNKQIQAHEGTPLEQWALLNVGQVADLKAINIHTVEQLASVHDGNLRGGMRVLRENARVWLDDAKDGAAVLALKSENDELKMQLEAMTKQNANLEVASEISNTTEERLIDPKTVVEEDIVKPITSIRKKKNGTNTIEDGATSNG